MLVRSYGRLAAERRGLYLWSDQFPDMDLLNL